MHCYPTGKLSQFYCQVMHTAMIILFFFIIIPTLQMYTLKIPLLPLCRHHFTKKHSNFLPVLLKKSFWPEKLKVRSYITLKLTCFIIDRHKFADNGSFHTFLRRRRHSSAVVLTPVKQDAMHSRVDVRLSGLVVRKVEKIIHNSNFSTFIKMLRKAIKLQVLNL